MLEAAVPVEIMPQVVEIVWTINSKKFAYPDMTFEELTNKAATSYS